MKIISKFHDYYDTSIGYGIDKSIIYKRKTSEIDKNEFPKKYLKKFYDYEFLGNPYLFGDVKSVFRNSNVCGIIVVFFCGKTYVGLEMSITYDSVMINHTETKYVFCYDYETAKTILANSHKQSKKYIKVSLKKLELFFNKYGKNKSTNENHDIHFEMNSPIILVRSGLFRNISIFANPCLRDIEFYKIIDPFTAYQELSMYISGVMGGKSPRMVQISDEDKISKHGFNKYSFRKEPKSKKKQ